MKTIRKYLSKFVYATPYIATAIIIIVSFLGIAKGVYYGGYQQGCKDMSYLSAYLLQYTDKPVKIEILIDTCGLMENIDWHIKTKGDLQ